MAYETLLTFRMGDVEDPEVYLAVVLYDKFGDLWAKIQPLLEKDCCARYRLLPDLVNFGHKVLIEVDWWNKEQEMMFKLANGPFPLER